MSLKKVTKFGYVRNTNFFSGADKMDDDFDPEFLDSILKDAELPCDISNKSKEDEVSKPSSSFLTDILNTETDIVLGKKKPSAEKKKRVSRLSKTPNEEQEKKDSLIHKGNLIFR